MISLSDVDKAFDNGLGVCLVTAVVAVTVVENCRCYFFFFFFNAMREFEIRHVSLGKVAAAATTTLPALPVYVMF